MCAAQREIDTGVVTCLYYAREMSDFPQNRSMAAFRRDMSLIQVLRRVRWPPHSSCRPLDDSPPRARRAAASGGTPYLSIAATVMLVGVIAAAVVRFGGGAEDGSEDDGGGEPCAGA